MGACSLKDVSYLSEGKPAGKGGNNNRGGDAGEASVGGGGSGGDAGAGANSGGSNGTGGDTSSTTTTSACSSEQTICEGVSGCISLASGKASGSTIEHCGSCNNTCSLTNATNATCSVGVCKASCSSGFKDCNSSTSTNDGCETNIATVVACGDCGRACSKAGVLNAACTAGKCAPTCLARYGDCNADLGVGSDDGCETDLYALSRCGTSCTSGVVCSPTQVCNSGACGAAQGVVEMSVPFDPAGKSPAEGMRFAPKFPSLPNLTDDTLTVRLYAPGATGGTITFYTSDADYTAGATVQLPLSSLSSGWVDVKVAVGHLAGTYDPSVVSQLNIQIVAEGTPPYTSPTLVYVDAIWSNNGLINDTFDASAGQFTKSSLMVVSGSQYKWFDALP
jgi:hypothetical protein